MIAPRHGHRPWFPSECRFPLITNSGPDVSELGGRTSTLVYLAKVSGTDIYITPTGADSELGYRVQARLTRDGAEMGSPYVYNIATAAEGIPANLMLSVRTKDLAAVQTRYSGERPACAGTHAGIDWGIGFEIFSGGHRRPARLRQRMEPAAPGRYRLTVEAQRAAPWSALATRQHVISDLDVNGTENITLPAVRYRMKLDINNRGRTGIRQKVTLVPDGFGASPAGRTPLFRMSDNDGKSWQRVPLRAGGKRWTAAFLNPAPGYVSLRTAVPGVVDQRVVRAYGVG